MFFFLLAVQILNWKVGVKSNLVLRYRLDDKVYSFKLFREANNYLISDYIRAQWVINLEIPVLVRSLKSSNVGLGYYLDGRLLIPSVA